MKKMILILLLVTVALFQFCSSTKKVQVSEQKISYAANVQPLIVNNCSPCHIPPKGNKEALNTYETAKANLDNMVVRMQRNPDEKGFMPFKHPKLSDSVINVFTKWKTDGFIEK